MVLVQDILASPMFADFHVVSGYNGISNPIRHVGFLEWESGMDLQKNFSKDEFVITTLAVTKDDPAYAESCLRVLIQHQVAAIAIKDVYFHEISDALRKFSEERNVPIMFFSDLYIDDVLYYIKTAILKADSAEQDRMVEKLLFDETLTPQMIRQYALQLNPFFAEQLVFCAFLSPKEKNPKLPSMEIPGLHTFGNFEQAASSASARASRSDVPRYRYTFLPFHHGFFHICTVDEVMEPTNDFPLTFLEKVLPHASESYRIGLYFASASLESLAQSLRGSFFANISCCIDEQAVRAFSDIGVDQLLFPLCRSPQLRGYYEDLLQKLTSASETPDLLLSTLEIYAKCGGDINLTAKETYQHSNTIRYRLQKIRKAWGCENNNISFNSQAFLFFRLHQLYQLLPPLPA